MSATSISRKLESSINKFFTTFVVGNENVYNESIIYDGVMNKFLAVDSSSDKEVPTCCLRDTISSIVTINNSKLYVPLHEIANKKSYKTAHMIFNHLIVPPSKTGTLQRVRTDTGKVYYGACGILLDENKNPIMLSTVNIKRIGNSNYNISDLTLYVNPSVFTGTDIMDKFIRDKVIPFILSEGITFDTGIRDSFIKDNIKRSIIGLYQKSVPKIIIDNSINKFFITPVESTLQEPSITLLSNIDNFIDFVNG